MSTKNATNGHAFQVGDEVRLKEPHGKKRERWSTARIVQFYSDIEGGVRLNRPLDGFVSWNVDDLCAATTTPAREA